ncbi:ribosome biogenesis GTPase Der [Bauldia sp.]|uniref:ribosome biogenesis GTPase Der n=1 Tax=Bauldia sp. TaxID=2575872 RepID=UPI003BAD341E
MSEVAALPRVAIIGRPNVGKSTLFNRLVGRRLALVDDLPGVTRDRREGEARLGDLDFIAIDTAGLEEAGVDTLAGRMRAQTEAAVASADVILFLIDARAGVVPLDSHFSSLLRVADKPVILLANKAEGRAAEAGLIEAYALGFGEPVAISAEHGEGMADLYATLLDALADAGDIPSDAARDTGDTDRQGDVERDASQPIRLAVVGRPNAGKSTLINRMIGEDRLLTGPEAGITRDSIAVDWTWRDRAFRIFDTAGLRRRARVSEKLEKLAVGDALRAIRFAEVVIVMIDATQPFEKQDLQIADLVETEGRAVVIAVNKWDLIDDPQATLKELREEATHLLPQIRGVALVPVSGLTGKGIEKLMTAVLAAHDIWNRRIATAKLNRWLTGIVANHPPPAVAGRRIKLRYLTQAKARPPSFVAFCSRPDALPAAWQRYLVNTLRDDFKLPGVPIRLMLRKGDNPFEGRKRKR